MICKSIRKNVRTTMQRMFSEKKFERRNPNIRRVTKADMQTEMLNDDHLDTEILPDFVKKSD